MTLTHSVNKIYFGQRLLTRKILSLNSPEYGDHFEYIDRPHISNIHGDTVNFVKVVDKKPSFVSIFRIWNGTIQKLSSTP